MEERAATDSLAGPIPAVIRGLYDDIHKWTDEFAKLEAGLEIIQQTEAEAAGDSDEAITVWQEKISHLVYDIPRNFTEFLQSVALTPKDYASALHTYSEVLKLAPLKERDALFGSCEEMVAWNDFTAFLDWIDTPAQEGSARGLAWLRQRLENAVLILDPHFKPARHRFPSPRETTTERPSTYMTPAGFGALFNDTGDASTAASSGAPAEEERESQAEKDARKARRLRDRGRRRPDKRNREKPPKARASGGGVHSARGGAGTSAGITQPMEDLVKTVKNLNITHERAKALVLASQRAIVSQSKTVLGRLKEDEKVIIYYYPGPPDVVAVGDSSIPTDLIGAFYVSAMATVWAPGSRRLTKRQGPSLKLSQLNYEQYRDDITTMLKKLGCEIRR